MRTYFCKLYIDAHVDVSDVQIFVDEIRDTVFHDVSVYLDASKNYDFDASAHMKTPYDFMHRSRCFVDAEAREETLDNLDKFQSGVVRLTNLLRGKGWLVTVMCDFEEKIISETGWNWTPDSPEPPGRLA